MATAIARIYVSDGFTVAADGRERCVETGHISSDSEQKIFGLHHCRGELACAITGAGRIGERYRLSEEIPAIALALAESEARNVGEYAELLGNELKRSIDGCFKRNKKSLTINLLFDGYLGDRPERARATIISSPEGLPVQINCQPLYPGQAIGFGSNLIHTSLFAPVPPYEQLRPYWGICQQELRTVEQSAAVARAIIEAQCDPLVAALDPEHCASIGGHVHIAKVTPRGFAWIMPPLPQQSRSANAQG